MKCFFNRLENEKHIKSTGCLTPPADQNRRSCHRQLIDGTKKSYIGQPSGRGPRLKRIWHRLHIACNTTEENGSVTRNNQRSEQTLDSERGRRAKVYAVEEIHLLSADIRLELNAASGFSSRSAAHIANLTRKNEMRLKCTMRVTSAMARRHWWN